MRNQHSKIHAKKEDRMPARCTVLYRKSTVQCAGRLMATRYLSTTFIVLRSYLLCSVYLVVVMMLRSDSCLSRLDINRMTESLQLHVDHDPAPETRAVVRSLAPHGRPTAVATLLAPYRVVLLTPYSLAPYRDSPLSQRYPLPVPYASRSPRSGQRPNAGGRTAKGASLSVSTTCDALLHQWPSSPDLCCGSNCCGLEQQREVPCLTPPWPPPSARRARGV